VLHIIDNVNLNPITT